MYRANQRTDRNQVNSRDHAKQWKPKNSDKDRKSYVCEKRWRRSESNYRRRIFLQKKMSVVFFLILKDTASEHWRILIFRSTLVTNKKSRSRRLFISGFIFFRLFTNNVHGPETSHEIFELRFYKINIRLLFNVHNCIYINHASENIPRFRFYF